jgi:lysophospholipase L1-like esterase
LIEFAAPLANPPSMFRSAFQILVLLFGFAVAALGASPSFADFDRRAQAGDRLNVVFFGASLTWGANASDPLLTSYRARVAQRLEGRYPQAHFTFWDAAIGGTNSQLGAFRLERDVLRHQPDLVFLDFTANDGINEAAPETLASYEALVRRIIVDGHAPVMEMIFPFGWDVKGADFEKMKRRTAHLEIAKAYHAAVGDAVALAVERLQGGQTTMEKIWPYDLVHPGDAGYELFADAAWSGYESAVKDGLVCAAPEKMLYDDTYLHVARVRLSTLGGLPAGWKIGRPNLTSAYFDMLMSRWLDDEVVASNRTEAGGKKSAESQQAAPLELKFRGAMVLLFGEGTPQSGKYRAYLDSKLVERPAGKETVTEFDAAGIAGPAHGNAHHYQVLAEHLDPAVEHSLKIEPLLSADKEQELRLESVCVAGGDAKVYPFQSK